MADESQPTDRVEKSGRLSGSAPLVAKVLEVILGVFAIGLIVDPFNSFQRMHQPRTKLDDIAVIYTTVAGYIIINGLFIIGHLLGDRIPKRTATLFAAVGAIMHVVAGSVMVHNWRRIQRPFMASYDGNFASKQYLDMLISGAVFTFVDAVVFVLDIFLCLKYA